MNDSPKETEFSCKACGQPLPGLPPEIRLLQPLLKARIARATRLEKRVKYREGMAEHKSPEGKVSHTLQSEYRKLREAHENRAAAQSVMDIVVAHLKVDKEADPERSS